MSKAARNVSKGHKGLWRRLYDSERMIDEGTKNRERVFGIVFWGTLGVSAVLCLLLFASFAIVHNAYVLPRLIWSTVSLLVLVCIGALYVSRKAYVLAAHGLVLYYAVIASTIVWSWGINTPFGILLFGLVIILAGILVRAKYALWATVGVTIILACAQISLNQRIHIPNEAWTTSKSSFGDVIGYSMGFSIIAVVSWLYGTQMERSLRKATEAEAALELEKASLEIKVAQRTAALEQTRIEELEQAYKFAELGSLSTALLHDLANYLTVLTMDIKDLHGQHDSVTLTRAQETIGYIDKMVDDVRDQMSGTNTATTFSVTERISAVVGVLNHKAHQQAVSVAWQAPFDKLTVHGDATRFNQMIAIILGNAIDASSQRKSGKGAVTVTVSSTESQASIAISNNGPPLTEQQKQMLFKPFQSTKKHGMGIGLFLAKQMAERHFAGSIELDSDNAKTTFRIIVPKHV